MGNLIDSVNSQPTEEVSTDSDSSDSLEFNTDEIVIDLDSPEYKKYLKHKRKMSRSEGNLAGDISYLQWIKTDNKKCISGSPLTNLNERTSETDKSIRRRSAPVIADDFFVVKKVNSEECETRKLGSKQRIKDIKKKYNLKDRDYAQRTYIWNEEDEKQIKKEREERRKLRKQIRDKYNLPTRSFQRISAVASG